MNEPVRLGGLFASAFPQRGDKSNGQPGASGFGTLLDDRQETGDRPAFTTGGEPPRWSWGKMFAPAKSSIPQFVDNENDNLFATKEAGKAQESASLDNRWSATLDNLWSVTRSTSGSRFAADWRHAQGADSHNPDEPVPEVLKDETEMLDPLAANEVASSTTTAILPTNSRIPIESGAATQRPDTALRTVAGNGDLETTGRGNGDRAPLGDGSRRHGQDAARPSGTRAEPAEQMRAQPGDTVPSRAAEGRIAEVTRPSASLVSDRQQSDPLAQRVTVVSSQTTPPAPPMPSPGTLTLPGTPVSQVVSAIRKDGELVSRAAAAASQAQEASAARPRPVHTLQIQLQPADLGRVTARMSIEGSQLRVELQVETAKARTQLANDSDAILKALKASGYEIDRVTIQQAPQAANSGSQPSHERSVGNLSAQGGEANETGEERRRREGSSDGNQQRGGGHEDRHSETARGGLYI